MTDSNSTRPSALPSAVSHARSGCGINPTTLRASLQMPAMLLSDPFGLDGVGDLAAGVAVSEHDAPARFERADDVRLREVVAFAVRDRELQHLTARRTRRERRVGLLGAHPDVLAVKLQVAIAQHRARQQPGLEQHLKAVADPEDRPAPPAKSATAVMIGENRAIAPVRR